VFDRSVQRGLGRGPGATLATRRALRRQAGASPLSIGQVCVAPWPGAVNPPSVTPDSRSPEPIQGVARTEWAAVQDVGIDPRRGHVLVPEQLLDRAGIDVRVLKDILAAGSELRVSYHRSAAHRCPSPRRTGGRAFARGVLRSRSPGGKRGGAACAGEQDREGGALPPDSPEAGDPSGSGGLSMALIEELLQVGPPLARHAGRKRAVVSRGRFHDSRRHPESA
jgi:hypothetical protein